MERLHFFLDVGKFGRLGGCRLYGECVSMDYLMRLSSSARTVK